MIVIHFVRPTFESEIVLCRPLFHRFYIHRLNDFIFDSISFESFDPGQRRIVCEKRQRHQFDLRHDDGRTRATAVSSHGRHARQQDAALLYVASQRAGI